MFNKHLKQDIARLQAELAQHTAITTAITRSNAVVRFDLEGKVIEANQNFLHTMGYDNPSQVIGKPHSVFCDAATVASPDYRQFWDKLRRGDFFSGRIKRVTATGDAVWLEATYKERAVGRTQ